MAQSKRSSFCAVPGCSSWAKRQPYLSFHAFPTDPEVRKSWTVAIRRDEGPDFCIKTGSSFVCSRHFTLEELIRGPAISRLRPGAVPTLFSWNNYCEPPKRETERLQKQQLDSSQTTDQAEAATVDHDYAARPPPGALDDALDYITELENKLEKVAPSSTLFSRFGASDDQIRFYTRFPSKEVFRIFCESIAPSASRLVPWGRAQNIAVEQCLDPSPAQPMLLIDEFLLYSFRTAAGVKEQLISDIFQVSLATVTRVTITWANYLFTIFSSVNLWISRDKVKSSLPPRFQKVVADVRVILDIMEVSVDSAPSPTPQTRPFPAKKQHGDTLKGLLGVAPCGLIIFVSPLYAGRISHKLLAKISGVLSLLEPGDQMVANQDFVMDELGAKLHPGHFTKAETEEREAISSLRGVVEQAASRVKDFHFWDSPVPLTLTRAVNQIWHNCCVLANYQGAFSGE